VKDAPMRIDICSNFHRYPAARAPLGDRGQAGYRVLDLIAKGVAELGHDVLYYLPRGLIAPLPLGITHTTEMSYDADIIHYQNGILEDDVTDTGELPWVRTCHTDLQLRNVSRNVAKPNWVYVSRTLAALYGSNRYVLNGVDPSDHIYSEAKDDYILFMCDLRRASNKGFNVALELCRGLGFKLIVAGGSVDVNDIEALRVESAGADVELRGEVWGSEKAELLAAARALLFPTRVNEAFGLVIAEALMSGTPVIASDRGACPELVTSDVGFVCSTMDDYRHAFASLDAIEPRDCREKAMRDYHYLRMAREYVAEYETEIGSCAQTSSITTTA
jgi:glycosyltransferase involved in cell wall biosynthesis